MRYKLYGEGLMLLEECDTLQEATRWAESYARTEEAGGWDYIEIVTEDGRVVSTVACSVEEDEGEYESD